MSSNSDTTRTGHPMATDPCVLRFKGRCFLYYSIPPNAQFGWCIGIATPSDLTHWTRAGELTPAAANAGHYYLPVPARRAV